MELDESNKTKLSTRKSSCVNARGNTACRVTSTHYAALSNPELIGGGYLGYLPTIQTWLGGTPSRPGWDLYPRYPPPSSPGRGGTPTIQIWLGGYPGYPPPSRPGWGYPGYPSHHPDLGWDTPQT